MKTLFTGGLVDESIAYQRCLSTCKLLEQITSHTKPLYRFNSKKSSFFLTNKNSDNFQSVCANYAATILENIGNNRTNCTR